MNGGKKKKHSERKKPLEEPDSNGKPIFSSTHFALPDCCRKALIYIHTIRCRADEHRFPFESSQEVFPPATVTFGSLISNK